jgi:hypothetical protein
MKKIITSIFLVFILLNVNAQMTKEDSIISKEYSIIAEKFTSMDCNKLYIIFAVADKALIINSEYAGVVVENKQDSIDIVYKKKLSNKRDKKILGHIFSDNFICNEFIYPQDSIVKKNTIPLYAQHNSYIYFTLMENNIRKCEICIPVAGWKENIIFFDNKIFKYLIDKLYQQ